MKWILLFLISSASLQGCGIAFIKLRQPLSYYSEKYGDSRWGLYKLMVLMDRERNRGQDGAGIAIGTANEILIDRDLTLETLFQRFSQKPAGTLLLGHLRYSTSGGQTLTQCHPLFHQAQSPDRSFALAGNFNLTNPSEIGGAENDTLAILKTLAQSYETNPIQALEKAAPLWDGGYVLCQIYGNGDALICRDPIGIRPAYFFFNEELFAAASERFALADAFGVSEEEIHPIPPGYSVFLSKEGSIQVIPFIEPAKERSCVFERIYFSKGNDSEIYQERKALGRELAAKVFDAIQGDLAHTVFTYVPNSSQSAYLGLTNEIDHLHRKQIERKIIQGAPLEEIKPLFSERVRSEMIIVKNQKIRTFISPDETRSKWVSQLYEVTQKVVTPEDTLVVVDDSIVRGITLKESLMCKLIALNPKRIILVSSAPPVRYPDCYGIDMSQLGRFVAFQAAVEIYKERNEKPAQTLSEIYECSTLDEIGKKVAKLVTPSDTVWKGEVDVIYQTLEGLNRAIPSSHGDWVFSGNYPTPGGFKVLETSFNNWLKKDDSRSY